MFLERLNLGAGRRRQKIMGEMVRTEDVTWRPGTHEAGSRKTDPEGVTGRGVNEYSERLVGAITEQARGKRVLDLGSGKNAEFGRSLTKVLQGNVEVHSLSPEYTDEDLTRLAEFHPARGFAQKLPYPDNNFGFIVGMQIHKHFPDRDHYLRALAEIVRVLSDDGVAYLGPALPDAKARQMIREGKQMKNKRGQKPRKVEHDTQPGVFLYDDAPPNAQERKQYGIPDTTLITKESELFATARGVFSVKTTIHISKAPTR